MPFSPCGRTRPPTTSTARTCCTRAPRTEAHGRENLPVHRSAAARARRSAFLLPEGPVKIVNVGESGNVPLQSLVDQLLLRLALQGAASEIGSQIRPIAGDGF